MFRFAAVRRAWIACSFALALGFAVPAAAKPPAADSCPTIRPHYGDMPVEDAAPILLREGMVLRHSDLFSLRALLPEEIWAQRRVFFYEGMRLEIGPCHRVFPLPEFYHKATQENAGKARLDEKGNLHDYEAGVPFAQDSIDPTEPDAAAKWAWNLEYRYRGAGPSGDFRLSDMPSRLGGVHTYKGNFFQLQTRRRSDLEGDDYTVRDGKKYMWVSGGKFTDPFDARHLAWRQMRPIKAEETYREEDSTFVYVPSMRKPRRAATAWVDGVYTPRYRVSSPEHGGGIPYDSNQYGPSGSVQPTAGISAAASEHIRRGFVGMSMRPNAYDWKFLGEREVLAPLNGVRPGYPTNPDRNFGESGLSVGSDTWDVRWAVVIEGQSRQSEQEYKFVTLYIDYQTLQPLYYITRRSNRLILDVGIFVHRYSGDYPEYPIWPTGGKALVFDPVASVFFSVAEGGTGWRRESYEVHSVPSDSQDVRRMTSTSELLRGR